MNLRRGVSGIVPLNSTLSVRGRWLGVNRLIADSCYRLDRLHTRSYLSSQFQSGQNDDTKLLVPTKGIPGRRSDPR